MQKQLPRASRRLPAARQGGLNLPNRQQQTLKINSNYSFKHGDDIFRGDIRQDVVYLLKDETPT